MLAIGERFLLLIALQRSKFDVMNLEVWTVGLVETCAHYVLSSRPRSGTINLSGLNSSDDGWLYYVEPQYI